MRFGCLSGVWSMYFLNGGKVSLSPFLEGGFLLDVLGLTWKER